MFKKLRDIDVAFRYVRGFTGLVLVSYTLVVGFVIYRTSRLVSGMQERIYILYNGKVLEAFAGERKDNVEAEAWNHVADFHRLFFSLEPDEKYIRERIGEAVYLADGSAWRVYENLKEAGFYANLVSGNITQEIKVDSIQVDVDRYPYRFRCFATERLIRSTSITTRNLVTIGQLRNVARTTRNGHGFQIERWEIVENKDVRTEER